MLGKINGLGYIEIFCLCTKLFKYANIDDSVIQPTNICSFECRSFRKVYENVVRRTHSTELKQ